MARGGFFAYEAVSGIPGEITSDRYFFCIVVVSCAIIRYVSRGPVGENRGSAELCWGGSAATKVNKGVPLVEKSVSQYGIG